MPKSDKPAASQDAPYEPYNPLAIQSITESLVHELLIQACAPLPPTNPFKGAGVYLLYYSGPFPAYEPIARRNSSGCEAPIYVGKAVPQGGRKGVNVKTGAQTTALFTRLKQHAVSIDAATNLVLEDFRCRYRVIEDLFIELAERRLIQQYKPLWNARLDGFGNKDPGKERYSGKRPDWDEAHPGRKWAPYLTPGPKSAEQLLADASAYLASWEHGAVAEEIPITDEGEEVPASDETGEE